MADVSDPKINEGAFVKFNHDAFFSSSQTLSIRGCSLKQIRCQLGSRRLRGSPIIFILIFFFDLFTLFLIIRMARMTALINWSSQPQALVA
jgi:hypothetical protein